MLRWLYRNTLQRKEIQVRQVQRESGFDDAEDTRINRSLDETVDTILKIVLKRVDNLEDGERVVGFRLRELDPYILRQHDNQDIFRLIDHKARRLGLERTEVSRSAYDIHYFTDLHRFNTPTP